MVLPGQHTGAAHLQTAYTIVDGYNSSCAAFGFYNDDVDTTGWGYLHVESNPTLDGSDQYYAAGFLEGVFTASRIFQSKVNSIASSFTNGTVPQSVYTWMTNQNAWVDQQIEENPSSPYWQQVSYTYTQVQGMFDGYTLGSDPVTEPLTLDDLMVLNLLGEVGDIQAATDPVYRESIDVLKMHDLKKVKATMAKNSHCSALIRLSPDGQDLFSAHTTWTGYANMLRTYKYYKIGSAAASQFSSYPGTVSSIDDFYTTSNNMVIIETTNNIANMSLHDLVVYTSVPTFVRVVVANALTDSGADWSAMYADNNSGTYNSQTTAASDSRPARGAPMSCLVMLADVSARTAILATTADVITG
jgi:hypothetical protein